MLNNNLTVAISSFSLFLVYYFAEKNCVLAKRLIMLCNLINN